MPTLDEMERLEKAATAGPWEACELGAYGDFDGESRVMLGDDKRIAVFHHGGSTAIRAEADADIELTVVLRNSAPALLACARALVPFAKVIAEYERWQARGSTTKPEDIRFSYGKVRIDFDTFRAAAQALASLEAGDVG